MGFDRLPETACTSDSAGSGQRPHLSSWPPRGTKLFLVFFQKISPPLCSDPTAPGHSPAPPKVSSWPPWPLCRQLPVWRPMPGSQRLAASRTSADIRVNMNNYSWPGKFRANMYLTIQGSLYVVNGEYLKFWRSFLKPDCFSSKSARKDFHSPAWMGSSM